MERPLQLSWRNVEPSDAIAARVRAEAARLERAWGRIVGCAVTLEAPSRHHRHSDSQYRVRIELSVPGGRLVVGRDPRRTRTHADLYLAVKTAFREVRRQLQDHVRCLDGRVKAHLSPAQGAVVRIFPKDGFGFLATADGREIYFHQRSVLRGGFGRLRVGSAVRFVEEAGEEGPQASTVVQVWVRRGAQADVGGATA